MNQFKSFLIIYKMENGQINYKIMIIKNKIVNIVIYYKIK